MCAISIVSALKDSMRRIIGVAQQCKCRSKQAKRGEEDKEEFRVKCNRTTEVVLYITTKADY